MHKIFLLFLTVFLSMTTHTLSAQNFAHEMGAINGPVNFRSDFGVRGDMETNLKNTGYGAGIIHYFNFAYRASCSCFTELTYFNDHFKLRTEVSHFMGNLRHYGMWVEKSSVNAGYLREMRGEFSVTNIGMQLEYFPMSIREYGARGYAVAPYFAFGAHYSMFSPEVTSTLGRVGIPSTTHPKYMGETINNSGGNTFSIINAVGARYKIAPLSDLVFELRWQYYLSDWVDGMNPNPEIYKENIANDWILWLNFGYIYTFL